MTEFAFVNPGAHVPELARALEHELHGLGHEAKSGRTLPEQRPGLINVVLGDLASVAEDPSLSPQLLPEVMARTIVVSTGRQDPTASEAALRLAGMAGRLYDVTPANVRRLGRQGLSARHFQVGFTPAWSSTAAQLRQVDLLFIGRETPRRSHFLATYADSLWRWQSRLILADGRWPDYDEATTALEGHDKFALLRSSRLLLLLLREDEVGFDWQLGAQAICAGAVLVSELATDFAPLESQRHFLTGRPETLVLMAEALLDDEAALLDMGSQALELIRREMPLAAAAADLVAAAKELDQRPVFFTPPPHAQHPPPAPAPWDRAEPTELELLRTGLKEVRYQLQAVNQKLEWVLNGKPDVSVPVVEEARSPAYVDAQPQVSVLLALYNQPALVLETLDSVVNGYFREIELVVVDDASTDDSCLSVAAWMESHPYVPTLLLRHTFNQGLAAVRNRALQHARGEFCFILDSDDTVYPHCVERLHSCLMAEPGAAYAYGMMQAFNAAGPLRLHSTMPWDPERLRGGPYIGVNGLIRTAPLREVGGYGAGRLRNGEWIDHDLWCNLAEHGHRGRLWPEVLGRYRIVAGSLTGLANLSHSLMFEMLRERYPRLMAGELGRD